MTDDQKADRIGMHGGVRNFKLRTLRKEKRQVGVFAFRDPL